MASYFSKNVQVKITSDDPSQKVYKGIYADPDHTTLLSSKKTYNFQLKSAETQSLYIRYTQKPVKIIFKKPVYGAAYKVTGTFGEIYVDSAYSSEYEKYVEFPTDTTPTITIGFTNIVAISNDSAINVSIIGIKVNDRSVNFPYSVTDVTPGSTITVEVNMETSEAATTTTTSTTTSTTTLPPGVLTLQSNAEGTTVEVTPDNSDPTEVSLVSNTPATLDIDMKGAVSGTGAPTSA